MSSQCSFHMLNNTRDLGGMHTVDGRMIRPGKLFRSGQLFYADEDDKRKLEELLEVVVDFRTEAEQLEKPDPVLSGVTHCSIPILDSFAPGVTRDEQSMKEAMQQMLSDPDNSRQYMLGIYKGFIEAEAMARPFGDFVRLLLTAREKGILWHCTAGKDRAGFASVIIQEILGIKREEIFADYIASNVFLSNELQVLYETAFQQIGQIDQKSEQALQYLFTSQEDYLSAAYTKAIELFGSFDSYVSDILGITDAEKERLKELYLI